MANQIEFKLKTSADLQGVKQLKKELAEVRNIAQQGLAGQGEMGGDPIKNIQAVLKATNTLEYAMQSAFDPKINTVNIEKFNTVLNKSKTNVQELSQNLISAGPAGQKAFMTMTGQLMNMGTAVKQTNKVIEQMGTTLKNTVKWGISSGLWNTMLSTTQQAYGYVKSLDSSLNDIRIVTGMSADEMERFGASANEAAKNLAVSTKDFTEGALIYFQQGLDEDTSTRLAEITAKAANVTGQSMAQVSEELTAVWNGYGVAAEDAERSVDSLAAIAAHSASNLQELSVGMSKVASAAAAMGVGEDQLASQISTIISITRQAPESVGTALKTIYARMSSIEAGAEEEGVNLMKYTKAMAEMGVNVLDANNKLRDMGDVIEEIGAKWQTMSREQQVALAQTMAGTRQYNNLIALFDNFDQYNEMMKVSANSAGTLQQQQETYLESIAAKTQDMRTAFEDLYDSLFDEKSIGSFLEGITSIVEVTADFADAIGGLNTILPLLGSLGLKVFKDQIGQSISQSIVNSKNLNKELEVQKANQEFLKNMGWGKAEEALPQYATDALKQNEELNKTIYDLSISLNKEQKEQFNNIKNINVELGKAAISYQESVQDLNSISSKYKEINTKVLEQEVTEKNINQIIEQRNKNAIKYDKSINALQETQLFGKKYEKDNIDIKSQSYIRTSNLKEDLGDNFSKARANSLKGLEKDMMAAVASGKEVEATFNKINESISRMKISEEQKTNIKEHFNNIILAYDEIERRVEDFNSSLRGTDALKGIGNDSTVKNLTERFRELSLQGKSTNEVYRIMIDELSQLQGKNKEQAEALQELKIKAEQAKNAQQDYVNTIKTQDVVSSMMNMVGAAGQLVMALSSIKNLGNIWSNDDLSAGEKIEQTIMALSMAIPMLSGAFSTLTDKKALDTLATWLNTEAEKANAKAKGKTAAANIADAAAQGAETATDAADTAVDGIKTVKNAGIVLMQGAKKLFTSIITGIRGIVSAIPGVGWAIIGVTALVGAANAAWKAYKKEVAEAASESAAKAQEEYDAIKQTTEATEELSKAYEELNGQRDSMSVEEYKNSLFILCEQYGLESEALRVLAGDYNAVADAIKNKQEAEKGELEKAAKQNAIASKNAFSANFRASLSSSQDDNGYYDFSTGFGNSQELENILKRFNVQMEGGKISSESLADVVSTYGQEFVNAVTEGHEKDTQRLADALNKMTEQVNSAYSANQDYKEVATSSYISKYGLNDSNKSGLELSQGINDAAEAMAGDKNLN